MRLRVYPDRFCHRSRAQSIFLALLLVFTVLLQPQRADAYSVLSHEEVVDLAWKGEIVPLLMARFPGTTPDELRIAHSYAYGGCVIQDLGYYPFGSPFFSDLLHYARTGDFVGNLLGDSTSLNEYAFALGAMAHYFSDTVGHPTINRATSIEYPHLDRRFGKSVTYGDAPTAHLRTEYGFDVVEVAHGRYSQENYRDFVGFQVAQPLLERAFQDTYGVPLKQVLTHEEMAINTYRYSVSTLIPDMTRVAVAEQGDKIKRSKPDYSHNKFVYRFDRTAYEKQWGRQYQKPGIGARIVAFFLRIVPKVGPFRALKLQMPNPALQAEYLKSMNSVVDNYNAALHQLRHEAHAKTVVLHLEDRDLDTGAATRPGEYALCDKTYARLLAMLVKAPQTPVPAALQSNVLAYYADQKAANTMKQKRRTWRRIEREVALLKQVPVLPATRQTLTKETATLIPAQ